MSNVYLLQTNKQQSVLAGTGFPRRAYSAFGAIPDASGPLQCFAGELRDQLTGCYHLGNGHRTFNPLLMRFHSADRLSPFGKGGVNAYAYCLNDPINFNDPSGQIPALVGPIRAIVTGAVNLGISTVGAYRGLARGRDFNLNSGFSGTRGGIVASATPESPVSTWSRRDKVVAALGAVTALASLGTGIARLTGEESDTLFWVDTAFAIIATSFSAVELYRMARAPRPVRYPIDQYEMNFRWRSSSVSAAAQVRG